MPERTNIFWAILVLLDSENIGDNLTFVSDSKQTRHTFNLSLIIHNILNKAFTTKLSKIIKVIIVLIESGKLLSHE